MNKSESKYRNTALLMDEALLLLLEKKEYEFITVTEICKKAGVNRTTFYLHYESMDDLLYETLGMINDRFRKVFNNEVIDPTLLAKEKLFLIDDNHIIPYLNFIKENKKIYKLINNNPYIFRRQETFENMYNELFSVILDRYGVENHEKQYIFAFFGFGLSAVVQQWIKNDCKDEIETIANIMKKVIGYKNED